MRREVLDAIKKKIEVVEKTDMEEVLPEIDVLYMTRIQKERFADMTEYAKVKGDEIADEVDATPHARYFQQVWNGITTRMALLALILGTTE